jgi:hypothetical protein
MSPEEEAEFQASLERAEAEWEVGATLLNGPRELTRKKNRRDIDRLVRRCSEPVVRGILVALGRLNQPSSVRWLSEIDLATTTLDEVVRPFDLGGRRLKIGSRKDGGFTVDIFMGDDAAGDGGGFLVERRGDEFIFAKGLSISRC